MCSITLDGCIIDVTDEHLPDGTAKSDPMSMDTSSSGEGPVIDLSSRGGESLE